MKKRILLALFLVFVMLFAFTACDDDDDDSRACTEEDYEIICAILEACEDAAEDDDYYTYSVSGTTMTITFKDYTCTAESIIDESDISVTIESGSTLKYVYNSSSGSAVWTFDIDATVDGTSHSLYLKYTTYDDDDEDNTISKIELDGVELTGFDDIDSSVRALASRTFAV